ncbi:cation:proton antiporter [Dactylosporangium vinaceum]|uniref:Cation:proton antiporter n=1 Tax=Dactylosporangium vinaceum TaxID=53362 RepID=A0ABV5ML46_9ACTN|nr:cation:proton antiporter [Dactylosporangium vinaceum]UAB94047.1 cation:proton antiporter [Dactylosporangium vinaceum]
MHGDQVSVVLFDLALIVAVARVLGGVARRLGQPPVVGEMFTGILLGPTLFHGTTLFPRDVRPLLSVLADVGIAVFMFLVGLEIDRKALRRQTGPTLAVAAASMLLPFGLGILVALRLVDGTPAILFLGACMSVTAFPVLARILTDRGLLRSPLGGLALAAAAVDDLLAWTMLAGIVTFAGAAGPAQLRMLLLPVYFAIMALVVRPLLHRTLAAAARRGRLTPAMLGGLAVGFLSSAAATEWMGLHFVFGAFLFGLLMPREGSEQIVTEIVAGLSSFSNVLLIPVFFVVAGLQVDLRSVAGAGLLDLGLILLAAVGGKGLGTFAAARLAKLSPRDSGRLAALMNTRGLTELIILGVGLQLGLIGPYLFTLMVVMSLVTTAATGPLLSLFDRRRRASRVAAAPAVPLPAVTTGSRH